MVRPNSSLCTCVHLFSIVIVYTQTLLYIVHVDEIESATDQVLDTNDKQQSNKIMRKVSKRTTASFNEQQDQGVQTPKLPTSTPPSFSFSNPFRRLNSYYISFADILSCPFLHS